MIDQFFTVTATYDYVYCRTVFTWYIVYRCRKIL